MFLNVISWVLKKTGMSGQMLVGYLLLISLSAVASVCAVLWWKNAKLETDVLNQGVRLVLAEGVVSEQSQQIKDLRELRNTDQAALTNLYGDVMGLNKNDATLKYMLLKLESRDETVQKYLDMDVPPGISCMYDRTCPSSGGDENGIVGTARTVDADTGKVPDKPDRKK